MGVGVGERRANYFLAHALCECTAVNIRISHMSYITSCLTVVDISLSSDVAVSCTISYSINICESTTD